MTMLGARLRQLRRERRCTLQEVSDGSGLTPSFLSRLERGIVNISVGNLRKVAAFFGVPITYFFTEELLPHGIVVRPGDRVMQESADGTILRSSILPEEAGHLSAEIITVAPGTTGQEPLFEVGRVLFYVLEGELACTMSGNEHLLGVGDVIYRRRPTPLYWSNNSDRPVVLLAASMRTED
jgi:transcriptional regulator with XRE-family HTH domain